MEFHRIAPQRPCDIWTYSEFEPGPAYPRRFRRVVFAYDFPTKDCLFNDSPYYFIISEAGSALSALGLSGAGRQPVETRVSDAYTQSYGTPTWVPEVEQLIVTGSAGEDDFGLQGRVTLIVSDRALALLRQHGLAHAQIFPYDPAYHLPTLDELLNRRT